MDKFRRRICGRQPEPNIMRGPKCGSVRRPLEMLYDPAEFGIIDRQRDEPCNEHVIHRFFLKDAHA